MTGRSDTSTKLKILVIGESAAGKTSLMLRYVHDQFGNDESATVGMCYRPKIVMVLGQFIKLDIWDTAGTERFGSVTTQFYRDAHGALLVYDVTDRATFNELANWRNELKNSSIKKAAVIITVGNKIDKGERQVTREEGLMFARLHNTLFIETSAKTNDGVQAAFENLIEKIIRTPSLWKETDVSETVGKLEVYVPKSDRRCEIKNKECIC